MSYDSEYVPRSAMAIFAHPDDAEFTVAGTVAKWTGAGCEVTFVLITSGNIGTHDGKLTKASLARIREREERASAGILGVKKVVFLRRDDCSLVPTLALRRELVGRIRKHKPEVVICGDPQAWFYEDRYVNHPDHRAAGVAALEAVFPCAEMELLWPRKGPPHRVEAVYVSSPLSPNTWVDITGTIGAKIAALKAHESQMAGWDPSGMIREWGEREAKRARFHAVKGKVRVPARLARVRHAECFRVMTLHHEMARPAAKGGRGAKRP